MKFSIMFGSTCMILFFVICGSLVNFCCATTFNLADHLTDDEKLKLFGSYEVPEHHIVETSWPRYRRAEDNVVFDVEYKDKRFKLNLKPTDKVLMAPHTPVWTATSDSTATNRRVRYDVLYHNTPKHLDSFRCYHDLETEAAVTIFYDKNNLGTMDGLINKDDGYLIKSFPVRAVSHLLKYISTSEMLGAHEINVRVVRSISQDDEPKNVSTNYHVLFKRNSNPAGVPNSLKRVVRRKVESSNNSVVYPEILVIADYKMFTTMAVHEALREIIVYWNVIDLAFSRLTNPRVRLDIGGIILAKDIQALEHLPVENGEIHELAAKLPNLTHMFSPQHPVSSTLNLFDMVMIMASDRLYEGSHYMGEYPFLIVEHEVDGEVSGIGQSCPTNDTSNPDRHHPGVGIFRYGTHYYGVDNGVMQLARLFGAQYDILGIPGRCSDLDGFAMSTFRYLLRRRKLDWSQCSIDDMRTHLNKPESNCLKNRPRWFLLEYNENIN